MVEVYIVEDCLQSSHPTAICDDEDDDDILYSKLVLIQDHQNMYSIMVLDQDFGQ